MRARVERRVRRFTGKHEHRLKAHSQRNITRHAHVWLVYVVENSHDLTYSSNQGIQPNVHISFLEQ